MFYFFSQWLAVYAETDKLPHTCLHPETSNL